MRSHSLGCRGLHGQTDSERAESRYLQLFLLGDSNGYDVHPEFLSLNAYSLRRAFLACNRIHPMRRRRNSVETFYLLVSI